MTVLRKGVVALYMTAGILAVLVSAAWGETAGIAPGTYRCSSYNVSGLGGSARLTQPLVLKPDGSYQYSSTRGQWSVRDNSLFLSKSSLWGAGQIIGNNTLRFEYDYRGMRHVVTWVCQECVSAEHQSKGGTTATGTDVGVSLNLELDTSVGGVSGFTIVPAEAAASYTHNAPLPEGAVQGLAWEKGPTTVALSTNRYNKLRSERQYVVFLSWPSETIPVAVLDLPAVSSDYTATLRATLDGASVLRQLKR